MHYNQLRILTLVNLKVLFSFWNLELGAYLELGTWNLEFTESMQFPSKVIKIYSNIKRTTTKGHHPFHEVLEVS